MADTITLNGFRFRFEIHGDGLPIVYTPGAFYRLESGRPFAERLSALGYRVLLWDRPNTGGSGLRFEPGHLLHLWADRLCDLLDHAGLSPAWLAGVANGLLFSLHMAVRHARRVTGLALIAAFTDDMRWWRPVLEATFLAPARVAEERGMPAALELGSGRWGVFDWPEQFALEPNKQSELLALNPALAARTLRAWASTYQSPGSIAYAGLTREQLAGIQAPAIVFSGADDAHAPEHACALHQVLPRSELVIAPDYHGAAWPAVLQEVADTGDFERLAASFAERIHRFIQRAQNPQRRRR
jgi:pimeloyl-ACP methyl ester carboxylesterase